MRNRCSDTRGALRLIFEMRKTTARGGDPVGTPEEVASLAVELATRLGGARRASFNRISHRLAAVGHSVYCWQLLNHLGRLGSATQRELATAASQHPAGVSRLLHDLEKKGAVVRRRASDDRRRLVVTLSPAGERLLKAMRPEVEAAAEEIFGPLTPAQQRALAGLLHKIVERAKR